MRYYRLIFAFLLSATIASPAAGQLSFSRSDLEPSLRDGQTTMFDASNAVGTTFDLGSKGSGNTWDFTVFQYTSSIYNHVFVDPALTPYAADFPDATHSQMVTGQEVAYVFYLLNDDGFYSLGYGTEVQGMPYILANVPPKPDMLFPTTLVSKWTYKGDPISPIVGFTNETEMTIEAISSGTLITPQGSYEALCMKNVTKTTQRLEIAGQVVSEGYSTSTNYMFMTKSGVSATLSVDSTDSDSMTPRLVDASINVDGAVNAVAPMAATSGFEFDAVWPNPLNAAGEVNISWRQDRSSTLEITLHDMLGRHLRDVFSGHASEGRHALTVPAADLPAGMYIVRGRDASGSGAQQRFTILR